MISVVDILELAAKLVKLTEQLVSKYRVARAQIRGLLDQMKTWHSRLRRMSSCTNFMMVEDGEYEQWHTTYKTIEKNLESLIHIIENRGTWLIVRFSFGRNDEAQIIAETIQKEMSLLGKIHGRLCQRIPATGFALHPGSSRAEAILK